MKTGRLPDGREVDTSSDEWRVHCHAQAVAKLPTLNDRRRELELIELKSGKAYAERLRAAMKALWVTR